MWKVLNILVKMSVCFYILSGSHNTYVAGMIAENTEPGAVIYILPPMPIKEVMDYPTTPGSIPLYKPSARKQIPQPGSVQHVQEVPYPGVYMPDQQMKDPGSFTPTQKVKRRRQYVRKQTIEQSGFDVSNQDAHQPGSNIPQQELQSRSYSPGQKTEQPEVPGEDMVTAEQTLLFRPLFVYRQQQERRRRRKRPNQYYSTGSYTRVYRPRYVKPICYRIP